MLALVGQHTQKEASNVDDAGTGRPVSETEGN